MTAMLSLSREVGVSASGLGRCRCRPRSRVVRSPALWEWLLDKLSDQRRIALEHRPLLFGLSDRSHK
jgi:hypothetical protein